MAAHLLLVAVVVAQGAVRQRPTVTPDVEYLVGTMTSCAIQAQSVGIRLQAQDRTIPIQVDSAGGDLPRAYRRLVGDLYRRDGECLATGTPVRVTRYRHASGAIVVVGIETMPSLSTAADRLWILRQWFDLTSDRAAEQQALFVASMLASYHNKRDAGTRHLWIRGTLREGWNYLRSAGHTRYVLEQFGRPSISDVVESALRLYPRFADSLVVVKGLPFMPKGPGAPYVGWWGTFPLEVYRDAPDLTPISGVAQSGGR